MFNKKWKQFLSLTLCVALGLGSLNAFAAPNEEEVIQKSEVEIYQADEIQYAEDEDLLLYYDFEELEDGKVIDKSGNGYDGTFSGDASLVESRTGKAARLSGDNDYINVPNEVLKGVSDVTVSADVWLDRVDTWTALFTAGNSSRNYVVMAAKGTPNNTTVGLTLCIALNRSEQRVAAPADKVVPTKQWVNIAYTQEGSTAKLYMNGELVGQMNNMTYTFGDSYVEGDPCYIGNCPFPDPTLNGQVDNFKIYSRALTAEELAVDLLGDEDAVNRDKEALSLGFDLNEPYTGTQIDTPLYGPAGSAVYWETSDRTYITENGIVRPDNKEDKKVTLTATIVSGDYEAEKDFEVIVAADPEYERKDSVTLLQIGDSNTEFGYLTMNMRELLTEDYGNWGTGFLTLNVSSFLRKRPNDIAVNYTGSWWEEDVRWGQHNASATGSFHGLIGATRTPGSTMVVDFIGSGIDLYYPSFENSGSFRVYIDGQDMGITDQAVPGDGLGHRVSFEGLKYGNHHMVVEILTMNQVNFFGADVLIGDREDRTVIHNWGNSESMTSDHVALNENIVVSGIELLNPDKVTVLLGTNDHGYYDTPEPAQNVENNLVTIIERVKRVVNEENIWLLSTFETNDTSKPNSVPALYTYWETSYPNAAQRTGVNYWEMGQWFGRFSNQKMSDAWHVNDTYGKIIMQELYKKLFPSDNGDLVIHYDFESVADGTVKDISGNGYDGTVVGEADTVASRDGNAIYLNGDNQYIEVPLEALKRVSDVTVSFDVKLEQIETWTALFSSGNSASNFMVLAAKGTPGGVFTGTTMSIGINGGENRVRTPFSKIPTPNTWVNITYTQFGNTARIYMDGQMIGENTAMLNTFCQTYKAGEKAYIGKSTFAADPTAVGQIDNFKIYARAFSEEEIEKNARDDISVVAADKLDLTLDTTELTGEDRIELPIDGRYGSSIYWVSSDSKYITDNGLVTYDREKDVDVTLTAYICSGEEQAEKEFTVRLKAKADAKTREPMRILQIGDSNTEFGYLTMNMREVLKENHGDYGLGFATLNASATFQKVQNDFAFTYDGTWVELDTALGGVHGTIVDSPNGLYVRGEGTGSELTVYFVGTSIDLYYLSWSGAGTFSVEIDGVDKGSVIQNQPADYKTHTALYDDLLYGRHVMKIKVVSGHVNFYGADIAIGDRDERAVIHTWGNGEATANDYAILTDSIVDSALQELNPEKVVILLGTNDHGALGVPRQPADVKNDLVKVIQKVQRALNNPEIWLLSTFETNDPGANPASINMLHRYWEEAFPAAAEETGVNYWAMGEWFGDYSTEKMYDAWHVNDKYGKVIMQELYDIITEAEIQPGDTDKTQLEALVKQAEILNEGDYTEESWKVLIQMLNKANEVLGNSQATQTEVDHAYNMLSLAMKILQGEKTDKTILGLFIIAAQDAKDSAEFSNAIPSVQTSFNKALEDAIAVFEDDQADYDMVMTAALNLLHQIHSLGLVAGNTTYLEDLYNLCKQINLAAYKDGKEKEDFTAALKNAGDILDDPEPLMDDVEKAYQDLLQASLKLVPEENDLLVELKELILIAEACMADKDKYVEATITDLQTALQKAQELVNQNNPAKEDIEKAIKDLGTAVAKLRYKADKSLLQETLAAAFAIDTSQYTQESVQLFTIALEQAQSVYKNEDLSDEEQDIVDQAAAALENAIKLLVNIYGENPDQSDSESDNDQTKDTKDTNNSNDTNNNTEAGKSNNNTGKNQKNNVKTGDRTAAYAMLWMLIISGSAVILFSKKKRNVK